MKKCWITSALWRPSLPRGQIWQSPTLSSRRCSNYSVDTTPLKIRPRLISHVFCPLLLFQWPLTYPVFPVTSLTDFLECAQQSQRVGVGASRVSKGLACVWRVAGAGAGYPGLHFPSWWKCGDTREDTRTTTGISTVGFVHGVLAIKVIYKYYNRLPIWLLFSILLSPIATAGPLLKWAVSAVLCAH